MHKLRLVLLTSLIISSQQLIAKCDHKDDSCWVNLADIHPTQPRVGIYEVQENQLTKLQEIIKDCKENQSKTCYDSELHSYLKEDDNLIPVVYSYNKTYDMVDHHHLSYAIYELYKNAGFCNISDESDIADCDIPIYIELIHNYSNDGYDQKAYWQKMIKKNYFWPYSYNGENQYIRFDYTNLPRYVTQLKDDPYRSYFGLARKQGGFKKPDKDQLYFYQFKWAACAISLGYSVNSNPEYNQQNVISTISFLKDNASEMVNSCTDSSEFSHFPKPELKQ